MCLGIPGQIQEFSNVHEHLARVDVSGVTRIINSKSRQIRSSRSI